ncbi:basal-body rod modification protein FlgD [mine drainage metagenome]|uniref:Basal-body rod modification protein FlgD n=1 Tax=mine drainage metagenome TaxID=410659 RepID=A0A1J5Q8A8_9ZZZZ
MMTGTSSTTVSSTTGTSVAATTGTGTSSSTTSSSTDMNAAQDRFMKLLVAQLNNQDPMNPMDNAQMTSQIAQINTVTGIQQVNDTLKSMADQFTAMQVLQGSSMVGRNVLVDGSTLNISNGTANGAVDLTAAADSVKVDILSPGGQVVDTLDLGALNAGQHSFAWDASKYSYSGSPSFKITASQAGQAVTANPLTRDTVQSVGSANGAMNVQLVGGSSVAYSAVKTIL